MPGAPFTLTAPSFSSRSASATSIISEATFFTFAATSIAARCAELPALTAEREANVPMPSAMPPVSPVTTVTSSNETPSWSATTCANAVLWPWPCGVAPVVSVTLPVVEMRTVAPS